MRKQLLQTASIIGSAIIGLATIASVTTAGEQQPWHTSLEDALAEAKSSGQVVLMEINGRPWCPPCNMQETNLLETELFKEWAKQFVLLDIKVGAGYDDEKGNPIWEQQMKKHGLQAIPAVVFLNADGSALGKLGPNESAQTWIEMAEALLEKPQ